ncbi:MAG: TonB-dependent receptor [Candidatus Omnitrophica bacterium]|nr:TonB-dependent receptor [Candidatus Omnitrophota bacterium]
MFKKFLICLMVLCFVFSSFGKISPAQESFDLGEIVVTATKTPHFLKDVPGNVTIVTKEEIERAGATDLGEALEKVGGIKISDYGVMGAATGISIRGSTSGQVLVLIDGRPTALPSLGTTNLSLYPVDNIERIEVVRGPYSSLYGADAFGGVVNIITKDAPEKPTTEFDLSYGTFNTQIYQLSHGAKRGKFGYFVTAGKNKSDGDRENSACDSKHFTTKLSYDINEDAKINLSLGYLYQSLDVPGSLSWSSPNAHQDDEKEWADLTYNLRLGERSDIMAKLFFSRHWSEYKDPDIFSDSETEINQVGLELQQNFLLNEMNLLTYGVAYKRDEVEVDDKINDTSMIDGGKELSTTGIYLQDEIKFEALPLTLVPGVRYDAPSDYEKRVSPKMSALYRLKEKTNIRASVGQAYRAPTVDDLYWYEDWGWGMGCFGNPDLKPEKSTSWDLGVEHQFNEKVLARTTYFRSEIEDLITWAETPAGSFCYVATNVDKALIQGVEAESKFQFTPEIFASLSYTYTDAKNKGETYKDKYLRYRPEDKVDCTIGYKNEKGFKASISVEYIGSTYSDQENTETNKLDGYPLLSARISKTIGKYAEVYLVGKNLTDEEYQVYRDYPMPGMSVTGGIKIKF